MAVGVVLAVASTRTLARFLYDLSPTDPVTYGIVVVIIAAAAAAALFFPARRATRVAPMTALRAD